MTKGTDSHLEQRDRVTTATAKRNHQMSEEQHKVADSELKLLRKNQSAKQAAYQAVQDEIRAVLSVCDDLPAGSFKQSMLDRLNHRSAVFVCWEIGFKRRRSMSQVAQNMRPHACSA